MVNIIKKLVPESKYGIKCPYSMTPTRIVFITLLTMLLQEMR